MRNRKTLLSIIIITAILFICTDVVYGVMFTPGRPETRQMPQEMSVQIKEIPPSTPPEIPPAVSPVQKTPPLALKPSNSPPSTNEAHPIPYHVPVLMYHSISDKPIGYKQLSVKTADFEAQMKYLSDCGYTALFFSDLPNFKDFDKPVIITFDDGYTDNYTAAYPVLKKYNLKATVFLIADSIDKYGHLTTQQINEMKDLVSFQSHTVSHPTLSKLDTGTVENELRQSKAKICGITNEPVYVLAYPCGDNNSVTRQIASKYYDYAVTVQAGYYKTDSGRYQINRLGIMRTTTLGEFKKAVR